MLSSRDRHLRRTGSNPPQIPAEDLLIADQLLKRAPTFAERLNFSLHPFCSRLVLPTSIGMMRVVGSGMQTGGEHGAEVDEERLEQLRRVRLGGAGRVDVGE